LPRLAGRVPVKPLLLTLKYVTLTNDPTEDGSAPFRLHCDSDLRGAELVVMVLWRQTGQIASGKTGSSKWQLTS
jgi:hypothetical protein